MNWELIGKLGGTEVIIEPFSITADIQTVEYEVEVADGEEWIFAVQITVNRVDGAFANQLNLTLDGSTLLSRLAVGNHSTGGVVTSTLRIEISGARDNRAYGRFFAVRVPG